MNNEKRTNGIPVGKAPCPECRKKGQDSTGDNLVLYSNHFGESQGGYCFACGYVVYSDNKEIMTESKEINNKVPLTKEEIEEVIESTGFAYYRGIRKETAKLFGVRYEINEETGQPDKMYFPVTKNNVHVGYKLRKHPKEFYSLGLVSKECDFAGQSVFQRANRDILIVGGEIDMLSAYQMLRDSQIQRGKEHFEPTPVISAIVGENSTAQQAALHYQWLDRYQRIILALDNDEAGKKAQEKLIKVLPRGKVYVMELHEKDPNEYLTKGLSDKFVKDFFDCKQYVPVGIIASSSLYDKLLEHAATPKVPLPPFMKATENMLAGGIPLGYILNIGAASGVGKTTVTNEILYHMIYNSPHRLGVISLELNEGQFAEVMLSRHLEQKLAKIKSPTEKIAFLQNPLIIKKAADLFTNEQGEPRWHLMTDRDGTSSSLQKIAEELVVSCGCKILVIDPLQDALAGMENTEQENFMRWEKSLVKSHNVSIINISHVNKSAKPADPEELVFLTEESLHGSSTLYKSGGANILMSRAKYSASPIKRNTTVVFLSKNRWAGETGPAGAFYYANDEHKLYDFEDYFGVAFDVDLDFDSLTPRIHKEPKSFQAPVELQVGTVSVGAVQVDTETGEVLSSSESTDTLSPF